MSRAAWPPALVLALAAGAAGVACGPPAAPTSTGAPLAAKPAASAAANRPPQVERVQLEPSSPQSGAAIRAHAEASDPDADPIRLTYTWSLNGTPVASGEPVYEPGELHKGDRIEVEVVASDGPLRSEPAHAVAEVGNRPPVVAGVSLAPEGPVVPGQELLAVVEAEDPDDDRLELEHEWLVNGRATGEHGARFVTRGLRRGDLVVARVVARDGSARSKPQESAAKRLDNSAPVLQGVPQPEERDGVFTYHFEAQDPDGDRRLRFRLAEAPRGMTLDPLLGTAAWRPAPDQVGVQTVEVVVEDPQGANSSLRFEVGVSATTVGGAATPPAAPAQ